MVMGYPRETLAVLARDLVRRQPSLTAVEVSEKLDVHRHTLCRALKVDGKSLASIKRELVFERLNRVFANGQAISLKQVWTDLGFASASAFARYIRQATGKSPSELRAGYAVGPYCIQKVRYES